MQINTDVDRVDIAILYELYQNDIITPLYAWQIKNFIERIQTSISYNTMVRRLQKLCEKEFILEGYKDRNAKTYYLSSKGNDFIKNDIVEMEYSKDPERIKEEHINEER